MRRIEYFIFCVLVLWNGLFSSVHAAGFWALDRGASNLGRGGANLADPADLTAVFNNPAALTNVRGAQVMVDGNWAFDNRQYTRAADDLDGDGTRKEYDVVQNDWLSAVPSPGIFAAYNLEALGLGSLAIGAGVYGPLLIDREWSTDTDSPQRYNELSFHGRQIHYALTAAYELPWYRLRIGVTGMLVRQKVDSELALNTFLSFPERSTYDTTVKIEATDKVIPSAVFAASVAPVSWLVLSGSFQPGWHLKAEGTAEIALGEDLEPIASISGNRATIRGAMAPVVRAAALYKGPGDLFDVEFAYVWEGWKNNDTIEFTSENIRFQSPPFNIDRKLNDVTIDQHWRDTYSFRVGGTVRLVPDLLSLRAGAFYERGAVSKRYTSVASFDLDKLGGTLGGRVELPYGLWIDMAAAYVKGLERTVDNSDVRIVNPLPTPPEKHWAVANGNYAGSQILFMVAVGARFGT